MKKIRRKDVGQWDHTNAMGWAMIAMVTLPVALVCTFTVHWAVLPLYLSVFALTLYNDATEVYDDETQEGP